MAPRCRPEGPPDPVLSVRVAGAVRRGEDVGRDEGVLGVLRAVEGVVRLAGGVEAEE